MEQDSIECFNAVVVKGHGVASGKHPTPAFPQGTLALQIPLFAKRGLDLSGFYPATLNLRIASAPVRLCFADYTFEELAWNPSASAETFSFLSCQIRTEGLAETVPAMIYYPHPETKPEHFQETGVIEVLATRLPELGYGDCLELLVKKGAIQIGT